jgi:hypothetical protein
VISRVILAASVPALALTGAGTAGPPVSLVASPSHVTLAGKARQTIRVTNSGRRSVVVDVTRAGFALDLRGRPRIVSRGSGRRIPASWLTVRPRRLAIPPGKSRPLAVSARLPRGAEPGDHNGLVLLTTRPQRGAAVAVRMRLGVVVVVRAPGAIVRRLVPLRLRVRRAGSVRVLELLVANRGNVTETLNRACVTVFLHRRGRLLARLTSAARQLLPRTGGIAEIRYRGHLRGWVLARIQLSDRNQCGRATRRTFRIRL